MKNVLAMSWAKMHSLCSYMEDSWELLLYMSNCHTSLNWLLKMLWKLKKILYNYKELSVLLYVLLLLFYTSCGSVSNDLVFMLGFIMLISDSFKNYFCLLWWFVLCVNLSELWHPDIWSNSSPDVAVQYYFDE